MANIDPAPSWADIRQLETTDRNLAGPGGVLNTQPTSIAARLNLLRNNATALNNTVAGVSSRQDAAESAIASLQSQVIDAPGTLSDLDHGAPISVTGDQFPDVISIDNSRGPVLALNESIADLAQRDEWLKSKVEALSLESGSQSVGYAQDSDLAEIRNVSSKLSDIVSVLDFGFVGDGVTDDAPSIQKALDYAYQKGYARVIVPYTTSGFRMNSGVVIRGVELAGSTAMMYRRTDERVIRAIAGFVVGPMFTLRSHGAISGFMLIDPNQKYSVTSYTEAWNPGPDGIALGAPGDARVYGASISGMFVVGIRRFCVQTNSVANVESLVVRDISGCPLDVGFDLSQSYDIPRFSNIHFNLNSYQGLMGGDTTLYYRKVANEMTVFRFARVDGAFISSCFAYGVKHFIHSYTNGFPDDTNGGGGFFVENSSCDICHVAFQIDRGDLNIGTTITGGFYTPAVKISGSEQAVIKFGAASQNVEVQISDLKCYGATVPPLGGSDASGPPNYHVVWNTTGNNNHVIGAGLYFEQYAVSVAQNANSSRNNVFSFSSSSEKRVLRNRLMAELALVSTTGSSPKLSLVSANATYDIDNFQVGGGGKLRIIKDGAVVAELEADGDFSLLNSGKGLVVKSPDGLVQKRIGIDNTGAIVVTNN